MTAADELLLVGEPYRVDEVHPQLAAGLGDLWVAVSRAGGAVGFLPDSPEAEIREAAEAAVEQVRAGRMELIVVGSADAPSGTVFLRRGAGPRLAHRADVLRLMVHPDLQGRGAGRALLRAAAAHAVTLGLEQLLLSARGGTGLPAYYTALGWTEVGVFPDALALGPGERRDEHHFQLRLR